MCPDMNPLQPPTPPGDALTDGALDRLVRALGRPADGALDPASLELAFDRLADRIRASEPAGTRRRFRRRTAVIVVFATALLVAAAAVGAMRTTHTGFFPAKAGTENDTSEFLRTDAPDFPPLVRTLVRDTPFPPGDSALARVPAYVRSLQPGADGIPVTVQTVGITGHFAEYAVCAWRGYWLQEHAAGHTAAAAAAARALEQVATSDALKKVDVEWPTYLAAARAEAANDPSAETVLSVFYRANCLSLPKPWAR
jgi:hypothetical protein